MCLVQPEKNRRERLAQNREQTTETHVLLLREEHLPLATIHIVNLGHKKSCKPTNLKTTVML